MWTRTSDARSLTAGGIDVFACFQRCDDLLQALDDPDRRAALATFLTHGGYPFPGGSVGGLVRHLTENDLSVRIGSPAHVVLSRLTQEMLFEAELDLAILEDRIEFYKRQSLAFEEQGGGARRFAPAQTADTAASLPRRERPGSDEPADVRPVTVQQVADRNEGPFPLE